MSSAALNCAGVPRENRVGAEMHRDHLLRVHPLHRLRGAHRVHGEMSADAGEHQVYFVELRNQLHVAVHIGVTGKVDRGAAIDLQDVACLLYTSPSPRDS